jgi:hypothetical protein
LCEEDEEIQRGRVGPVNVFEHDQDRRPLDEQRQRVLEHAQLRGRLCAGLAERTERIDERLVRQLGADEVDRASEQHLEAQVACACCELGREARLADSRLPRDEGGRAPSGLGCGECVLELRQLASPSDERGSRARPHRTSIAQADPGRKSAAKAWAAEDTARRAER